MTTGAQAPSGRATDPPTRRRSTLVVAVGIVVLAVLVFLAFKIHDWTKDDPKPDAHAARFELPSSFGSFSRATDAASAAQLAEIRTTVSKNGYQPKYQIYTNSSGQRLIVSGVSARDSAAANDALSGSDPENQLSEALIEFKVIAGKNYSPAPYTGAFRCGTGVYGATATTAICGWTDSDTYAIVADLTPQGGKKIAAAELATVTRTLRSAAESH